MSEHIHKAERMVRSAKGIRSAEDDWHSPAEREDQLNRLRQQRGINHGFRPFDMFHGKSTTDLLRHFNHPAASDVYRQSLAGELGFRARSGDHEALDAAEGSDLGAHPEFEDSYYDDDD